MSIISILSSTAFVFGIICVRLVKNSGSTLINAVKARLQSVRYQVFTSMNQGLHVAIKKYEEVLLKSAYKHSFRAYKFVQLH